MAVPRLQNKEIYQEPKKRHWEHEINILSFWFKMSYSFIFITWGAHVIGIVFKLFFCFSIGTTHHVLPLVSQSWLYIWLAEWIHSNSNFPIFWQCLWHIQTLQLSDNACCISKGPIFGQSMWHISQSFLCQWVRHKIWFDLKTLFHTTMSYFLTKFGS